MNLRINVLFAAVLLGSLTPATGADKAQPPRTMNLTSTAFAEGQPMPRKFTCEGSDISPALT